MRDFRFRAWHKEAEEMLLNKHQGYEGNVFLWLKEGQSVEIMQYTGLKDKNGKDIYEGDIYTQGDHSIKYKVIFEDGGFIGNQIGNQSLAGLAYWKDWIEIIGNIYENPELLEKTND